MLPLPFSRAGRISKSILGFKGFTGVERMGFWAAGLGGPRIWGLAFIGLGASWLAVLEFF